MANPPALRWNTVDGRSPDEGRLGAVLFVAALAAEVAAFEDVPVLLTGCGKLNASVALSQALAVHQFDLVVNVGTAGSLDTAHDGIHVVGACVEHDLDALSLERLTGERPVACLDLGTGTGTVVATGDRVVADPAEARRIASLGAHLVDMEAFALARVCAAFGVPFLCAKYVSDQADAHTATAWTTSVHQASEALFAFSRELPASPLVPVPVTAPEPAPREI
ncbi:MAG: nucleosidase [Actinomycetota bacterium]|nr:nucleosidase [Actinomycetota bacterium]